MPDDIANPSNISSELGRILKARNDIRTKLNSMNLGTSGDNISTLASIINDIPNQGNVTANVNVGESYTIPRGYHTGSGTVTGTQGSGQFLLQTPDPVTPTKSQQNVTPDNGYYGLAAVTIKPIPEAFQDVTSVNVLPSQVLATRIYVDSTGSIITGTMPNNGAVSQTISVASPTYTVPTGYHNGSGTVTVSLEEKTATPTTSVQNVTPTNGKVLSKVTVNAIPAQYKDTTNADALAAHVLSGKKFVNSTGLVTGTMANNGAIATILDVRDGHTDYNIPEGYHNGAGAVAIVKETKSVIPSASTQTITPTAGKVLSSVTVNAIPSPYYDVSGVTAAASQVLTGTSYVTSSGALTSGTMADRGAVSQTLSTTSTQYTVPQGYHSGSGTVKIVLEDKAVTPAAAAQTVYPTAGKVFNKVTVNAIPAPYYNTSGVTAVASHVLTGENFVNSSGTTVTGTMASNGAVNQTLSTTSTQYTVPIGYHNGSGTVKIVTENKTFTPTTSIQTGYATAGKVINKVTVNAIPSNYKDTTGADADRADVLSGKIFVNENGTYTGSMPNRGAVSKTLDVTSNNQSYTIPAGYHNGSGTVNLVTETKTATPSASSQTITPTSGKVLSQVTVNAIPAPYYNTSGVTAVASHVLTGEKFVNSGGTTVTGTMVNNGAVSQTLSTTSTQYTVPTGFHNGSGTVKIVTEDKTFTPTTNAQTVYATAGKVINKVTVNAIPSAYQNVTAVTAVASHVLTGEVFVDSGGTVVTGTMADKTGYSIGVTASTGNEITLPTGYYENSKVQITKNSQTVTPTESQQIIRGPLISSIGPTYGLLTTVTVNAIPSKYKDTTDADAVAANVLSGKKFVNSTGTVTGTMANNGAVNQTLTTASTQYTVPQGYHSGSGTVKIVTEDRAFTPAATAQTAYATAGKVINKVTVNAIPAPYYDVSGVTAVASHVVTGEQYVDSSGTTITGTMAVDSGNGTIILHTSKTSHTIESGYHVNKRTVTAAYETKAVTPTESTQTVRGTSRNPSGRNFLEYVTVNPIPSKYKDTTGADAVAANVLSGKKFVNTTGTVTGTMTNNGSYTSSIDGLTIASKLIPQGYHDGTGYIYLTNDIEVALAAI